MTRPSRSTASLLTGIDVQGILFVLSKRDWSNGPLTRDHFDHKGTKLCIINVHMIGLGSVRIIWRGKLLMIFRGFCLSFPKEKIRDLAACYPPEWDEQAFLAGKKISEGDYSRSNLEIIVRWKSERRLALIAENSQAEISDALRLALLAEEPRSAFAVLIGLQGVGTPMASSILTAIDQDKYTIIDYRALEALGAPDFDTNLNFYLRYYFPECKRLSSELGISLRTLDRALWSWSKASNR